MDTHFLREQLRLYGARRWRHRRPGHEHGPHGPHGLDRFFRHGRGGRAVRRGNVRYAILSALEAGPMHGYQVIQELESRTQGRWRPSAGSVYPTLQQLEDEGLLSSAEAEGRRTYALTDAGRSAANEHPLTSEGWLEADADEDLRGLAMSVVAAAKQVERIGSDAARDAARATLVDARKRLYRLLAEDEEADEGA
jgi:DNA-binding PadR family transcriptional regulator